MKHSHQVFNSRLLAVAAGAVLSLLPAAHAQSGSTTAANAAPVARITQAIDEHNLVRLSGNTPAFIAKAIDLGAAADDLPLNHMQLLLKSSTAQQAALKQLLKEQQQPGSPNYHKWLTPESYGAQFGVSDADISKITTWLSVHGFTVESVAKSHSVITFSGTGQQLGSAFHTTLHQYSIRNERHYANSTDPMIPAALVPVVSGFSSLTSYGPKPLHTASQLAKRKAGGAWQKIDGVLQTQQESKLRPQFTTTINGSGAEVVAPSDFATIYDVAPLWSQNIDGTAQTIAIVAQSDVNPADVDAFRAAFGLPAKRLNVIIAGQDPGLTADSTEAEAALDVEWAGAMAKNATIDLVVSAPTNTGGGVLEAAQYAVDNNLAPTLSMSWGECELGLGASGNQFFNDMWQQAAAQGITVLVAAGDSGSAGCDQNAEVAESGEQVNGFASTPYNTAVGGTDFSANFPDATVYWNATNDPTTLASAKGYIPETPWNESCASPEVLAAAQATGLATDTTNEQFCNDFNVSSPFLNTAGGSGGSSSCLSSNNGDPTTCTGAYPAPDWQLKMPGMPLNGVRNMPDVSFFAGSGIWGSAYPYCQSDATPDGACNYQNGDLEYLVAGGTSFASPAFAGVVALLNQKSQSQLGNINYTLYQLGAAQYNGSGATVFHDITAGTNAMPCLAGTFAVLPSTLCNVTDPDDEVGVLPDYSANTGYDRASGLGSVDVAGLADAWTATVSGLAASKTTLTLTSAATMTYGTPVTAQIQVAAASGSNVPSGAATLFAEDTAAGTPLSYVELSSGSGTTSGNGMNAGAHNLVARYAGDSVFGASTSAMVPITVTQAATTMILAPSHTAVVAGQSVSFEINLETNSKASSPTGTVVLTNTTTGAILGSIPVSAQIDPTTGASIGHAFLNISPQQLSPGSNTITAAYNGDGNYIGSSSSTAVSYTDPFSVGLSQATLTLTPGSTTGNTIVVTAMPSGTTALNAANVGFSCPGALPAGLTCAFSTPTLGSNGVVSSTLTILLSGPLAPAQPNSTAWLGAGGITGLACIVLLGIPARKRRYPAALALALLSVLSFGIGCGGSSPKITANTDATSTTISASSSAPALNNSVTLSAAVATVNGSGSPSGSITFQDGANVLGTASLSGGKASYAISTLPIGTHTITAVYGGDSTYNASTSPSTLVDVTLTAPLTIQVSDNAGNIAVQTLTVTVK